MTQLIDTNILIKRLKEKKPVEGKISVKTLIEMLRGTTETKRGILAASAKASGIPLITSDKRLQNLGVNIIIEESD